MLSDTVNVKKRCYSDGSVPGYFGKVLIPTCARLEVMVQKLVFESDEESALTDDRVEDLVRLLRSLTEDDTSFSKLRLEISGSTLPRIGVAEDTVTGREASQQTLAEPEAEETRDEEAVDEEAEEEEEEPEEEEEDVPEIEQRRRKRRESEEQPAMNPGTRRFTVASVLYHADGPLTTGEIAELSEGEDWELGQSAVSSELYRMYGDNVVNREQGEGSAYEYELTDVGEDALEDADSEIEPNLFSE